MITGNFCKYAFKSTPDSDVLLNAYLQRLKKRKKHVLSSGFNFFGRKQKLDKKEVKLNAYTDQYPFLREHKMNSYRDLYK